MSEQRAPYALSPQIVTRRTRIHITIQPSQEVPDEAAIAQDAVDQFDARAYLLDNRLHLIAEPLQSGLERWLADLLREQRIASYRCEHITEYANVARWEAEPGAT